MDFCIDICSRNGNKFEKKIDFLLSVFLCFLDGPVDIKIQPYEKVIDISEGETLGPYECTADCNPPCLVRWSSNGGSNMELEGSTLKISKITRYQKGNYKCDVIHKNDHKRHEHKSFTVNVLCKSSQF